MTLVVAVVGPTATGKSDLGLALAHALDGEVVNTDAMQLYRGMDIGTAKLAPDDRRGIPHHRLDVLDVTETATVANYQSAAVRDVEDIIARGKVPVIVGGSMMYVQSLLDEWSFPATDPDVRAKWEKVLADGGTEVVHRELALKDPEAAASILATDGRRMVRALEVVEITGAPFGAGLPSETEHWRPSVVIGLQENRLELIERLDRRVRAMWRAGLLDEVARLLPAGLGVTASRAIGYAQAISQLNGDLDEQQAMEQTAALTRRYARRQVGWFARYTGATWIEAVAPTRLQQALSALDTLDA
jgi:tRNA dimethylallyltransferase